MGSRFSQVVFPGMGCTCKKGNRSVDHNLDSAGYWGVCELGYPRIHKSVHSFVGAVTESTTLKLKRNLRINRIILHV